GNGPRAARYDGVFLPAGAQAGDRRDLSAVWWQKRTGRSAPASQRVWDPLAFQPGRDPGGAAAGDRGGESVDAKEVQGLERAEEEDQPDARPDRRERERAVARESQAVNGVT